MLRLQIARTEGKTRDVIPLAPARGPWIPRGAHVQVLDKMDQNGGAKLLPWIGRCRTGPRENVVTESQISLARLDYSLDSAPLLLTLA